MGALLPGGWPELMAANHALALAARDLLCEALGIAPPAPDDMIGSHGDGAAARGGAGAAAGGAVE